MNGLRLHILSLSSVLLFALVVPCLVSPVAGEKTGNTVNNQAPDAKKSRVSGLSQDEDPFDPLSPINPIYLGKGGVRRSTGDPTISGYASEAARLGSGWHPPALSLDALPTDKFNLINWVGLVNKGAINPRPSLDMDVEDIPPLNLNILFKMRGGFVDNVVFPHDIHTFWLNCTNCHDKIFLPRAGSNDVKMQQIVQGEWCGRCHGKVAFPISDCTRCHRFPAGHEIEETAVKRTKKFLKRIKKTSPR